MYMHPGPQEGLLKPTLATGLGALQWAKPGPKHFPSMVKCTGLRITSFQHQPLDHSQVLCPLVFQAYLFIRQAQLHESWVIPRP